MAADGTALRLESFGEPGAEPVESSIGSLLVPERLGAWAWTLGYTAALASLSTLRYYLWLAHGYDLGLYEQGLWLLSHGGVHAVSSYTGEPILARSASYVLLLLAPAYAVLGLPFLFLLQSFALGSGYLFIRSIARSVGLADVYAHRVGVVYLIFPTILGANLFDFHPVTLAVPLLFGLIWAVFAGRWLSYALFLFGALITDDRTCVVAIGVAVVLLARRQWAAGLATLCVSALAASLDLRTVIPALASGTVPQWQAYYANLGSTPAHGILTLAAHPADLVDWLRRQRAWEYLIWMLAPLAAIAASSGRRLVNAWWLPALLILEANLLSPVAATTSPFDQLSVLAVPFLFAAVLWALRDRGPGGPEREGAPALRGVRVWLVLPLGLLLVFAWEQHRTTWLAPPAHPAALTAAVAKVPNTVPVLAQDFVIPHLANRRHQLQIESVGGRSIAANTYVVLDATAASSATGKAALDRVVALVGGRGNADRIFNQSGVEVYRLVRSLRIPAVARA